MWIESWQQSYRKLKDNEHPLHGLSVYYPSHMHCPEDKRMGQRQHRHACMMEKRAMS